MGISDEYYTLGQLAEALHVSRQTIYHWRIEGRIIGEKIGRETVFPKSLIEGVVCSTCGQFIKARLFEKV